MNLSTTYLGLQLNTPLVPAASPLSDKIPNIRQMEDSGAGAVVLYSLFEEQINLETQQLDHFLNYGTESYGEALSYFPEAESYRLGPDGYLNHIREAKEAVDIPIIASLNGVSSGGWTEHAKLIEQAGADAMELNIYFLAADPRRTSHDVEQMYINVLREVKKNVNIPVAVKLSPYFSALANMASRLREEGADALVLFNRFLQPDLNIEALEVDTRAPLSTSNELLLPLRWIAVLFGKIPVDFALTTGVHTHRDVLKGLMAGAAVTQVASCLLKNGIEHLGTILQRMQIWMEEHEYESVMQMRGSLSQRHVTEAAAFERAHYVKVLQSW